MTPSADGERERLIAECSHQFHRVFHAFWENSSSAWLELDLSITQLRNLIILSLRGPQHVGQLAAALEVSEPSASQIVDRLAQRAFVRRDPDPTDRRRILVSITEEGERLLDSVRTSRSAAAERLLDQLDDGSLRALAAGTRALADAAGASEHPDGECGLAVAPTLPVAGGAGVSRLSRRSQEDAGALHDVHSAAHDAAVQAHSWSNLSKRRTWLVLASVMAGMLLAAVDQTVVGTAMPRVIADLNGMAHYAWVATAYLLASTASMPIWGKLSDAYGRKVFFIVGMVLFMVGSALCGQAHSMTELILFRGLQGLGGGAMMPINQAIIGDLFPPSERGKWAGLLMSVFGLATIIGPTLGGWITDNLGWRWVFYVNLPVGIPALILAAVALPAHVRLHKHRIDYGGAAILIAASVPLLLGFSWGGTTYPWGSGAIIGLFAFSVVAWVAFVFYENRAAEPILSPALFKNRTFSVASVAGFIAMAGMFGAIMFLPLFVQGVLGDSATNSGLVLTPLMLGFIASSIIGGQLLSRTGRYKWMIIISFVITVIGLYLLSTMGVGTSHGTLIGYMVVTGLGMGVSMVAFTIVVQNAFPLSRLGEVTAGMQFFRSIGGTIGLAIFGTVLNNQFASAMHDKLPGALKAAAASNPALLSNPQVLVSPQAKDKLAAAFDQFGPQGHTLFQQFMGAVRGSMDVAIGDLFIIAAVVTAAGLLVLFLLKEIPLRTSHAMPEDERVDEGARLQGRGAGAEGEARGGAVTVPEGQPEM